MNIVLIAAIGKERQLGLNNELLWQLPGDLPRFKQITMGAPIVMGRKTFDSIGRPLPGRANIVLSRNAELQIDGVQIATTIEQALDIAEQEQSDDVFIIGGGEIYSLFLDQANVLELTLVDDSPKADAFFPEIVSSSTAGFKEVSRESKLAGDLRYHYVRYERVDSNAEHCTNS